MTSAPALPPTPRAFHHEEVISADQWSQVSEGESLDYYPLSNGTWIVTDPARPLPDVVTADIQRRLDVIGVDESDGQSPGYAKFQAERALEFDVQQAGKNIVTLRLRYMAVPYADGTSGGFRWVATSNQSGWWMQWDRERDALLGNVNAWVGANGAPGQWVVFVGPGAAESPSP